MARIRSIKPEFWTSEQVVECSPIARLLFVGLWTFCDDGGVHPASARRLKMEVFPGDDFTLADIEGCIKELLDQGLIAEFSSKNERFWHVTGWSHQKIDKPTFRYPQPTNRKGIGESSSSVRRVLDETSPPEGRGEESKGKERKGEKNTTPNGVVVGSRPPTCPHQSIIDLYHATLPTLPRVREWTDTRKKYLQARWREDPGRQTLDWWQRFFEYVAQSPFLTGQADGRDGRPPFLADLEWLIRPANFAKVIEGRYHQEQAS